MNHRSLWATIIIAVVVLSAGHALAECRSRNDVCNHVNHCLNNYSNDPYVQMDRKRILDGAEKSIGNMVWRGTRDCQRRISEDSLRDFEWRSGGCGDSEYASIARSLLSGGTLACYARNKDGCKVEIFGEKVDLEKMGLCDRTKPLR